MNASHMHTQAITIINVKKIVKIGDMIDIDNISEQETT